jgi:hypothetical protein
VLTGQVSLPGKVMLPQELQMPIWCTGGKSWVSVPVLTAVNCTGVRQYPVLELLAPLLQNVTVFGNL